jgi:gliding motility-associated-like protein
MKKLATTTLLLLLLYTSIFAQNEGNIWYFGATAGIDFNGSTPTALTNGALFNSEGCASISDGAGNLLFYTDGRQVYNRNHVIMPNGAGLKGHISSSQSGVIINKPGSDSLYYIFTVAYETSSDGFQYSIVDMSLDSGKGNINATKNVLITQPTCEKVTAIPHQNGVDYWIITHLYNSDAYHSYLLTSSGLSSTPVVTNIGVTVTGNQKRTIGYLKPSQDGTRIVAAHNFMDTLEVLDFNNANGTFSNCLTFGGFAGAGPYGVEFSPNGRFLYAATEASSGIIYQYDLEAGNNTQIDTSRLILNTGTGAVTGMLGALQIAPDGKIYAARWYSFYLGVINNPDSLGNATNYVPNGFHLGGKMSIGGLPNFPGKIQPSINYDYTFNKECLYDSISFELSNNTVDSVQWDFDDPGSGSSNVSNLHNPQHLYSDSGWYDVALYVFHDNIIDTVLHNLYVVGQVGLSLGNDITICKGDTISLGATVSNETAFIWTDTSLTNTVRNISLSGDYIASASNSCYTKTDTVNLTVLDLQVNLGPDTSFCFEGNVLLNATQPNVDYLWSDNTNNATNIATTTGFYWVEISQATCTARDTVYVEEIILNVDLGPDTTLCDGISITKDVSQPKVNYLWSDLSTDSVKTLNSNGNFWVTLTRKGCEITDSITIQTNDIPLVDLGNDTTLCTGEIFTLNLGDPNRRSLEDSMVYITETGYFAISETNECGTSEDSIYIEFITVDVNLGEDTLLCDAVEHTLSAYCPNANYLWSDNSTQSSINVIEEGEYWVELSRSQCSARDTVYISTLNKPNFNLGNDSMLCENETITFILPPDINYNWSDGSNSTTRTFNSRGVYTVTGENICGLHADTIAIDYQSISNSLGADTTICEGETVTVNAQDVGSYEWSNGSLLSDLTIDATGLYWLRITKGNCTLSDSIYVNVTPSPNVNLGNDFEMCAQETRLLRVRDGYTYEWQDGSTANSFLALDEGKYWVTAEDQGCINSDTVAITLSKDCDCIVEIPNAFTPNYNSLNEAFGVVYSECKFVNFQFTIYNRWGEKIFETNDPNHKWNGVYQDKESPQGAYIYTLFYRPMHGRNKYEKGTVTLLR